LRTPDGRIGAYPFCLELRFRDGRWVRGWFESRDAVDRAASSCEADHAGELESVLVLELLAVGGTEADLALPEALRRDTSVDIRPAPASEEDFA
jgi:hypothetical protein